MYLSNDFIHREKYIMTNLNQNREESEAANEERGGKRTNVYSNNNLKLRPSGRSCHFIKAIRDADRTIVSASVMDSLRMFSLLFV